VKLEQEVGKFEEQNKQMASEVKSLAETTDKYKQLYNKFKEENEKLARIADDMKEQLGAFDIVKEQILGALQKNLDQMDQKMKAMDRSLLEKIAADIEFMDKDAGLSPDEFSLFLKRVPAHLRAKFEEAAGDFEKYDTDGDGSIDYDELTRLLDHVMN